MKLISLHNISRRAIKIRCDFEATYQFPCFLSTTSPRGNVPLLLLLDHIKISFSSMSVNMMIEEEDIPQNGFLIAVRRAEPSSSKSFLTHFSLNRKMLYCDPCELNFSSQIQIIPHTSHIKNDYE